MDCQIEHPVALLPKTHTFNLLSSQCSFSFASNRQRNIALFERDIDAILYLIELFDAWNSRRFIITHFYVKPFSECIE